MKLELMMGRLGVMEWAVVGGGDGMLGWNWMLNFLSLGLRKQICRGSLTHYRSINLSNISLDPDRLQSQKGRCRPLG